MPGPLCSILTASQVLCWEREEPEAWDKRFCVVLGPPSLVFLMILFLTVKLWGKWARPLIFARVCAAHVWCTRGGETLGKQSVCCSFPLLSVPVPFTLTLMEGMDHWNGAQDTSLPLGAKLREGVEERVSQNLLTLNSQSCKGSGTCMMKNRVTRSLLGVLTSWPSLSGRGGVTLLDSGHAGVLFPLCPATQCLSGGFPGLLPEPSTSQYPLKGFLEVPRATPQWKLQPFLQKGRRVGGFPGRDRVFPTANVWMWRSI